MNFFHRPPPLFWGEIRPNRRKKAKKGEKNSNVAGRWAGPNVLYKGVPIEGWKVRRRRVVYPPSKKKNIKKIRQSTMWRVEGSCVLFFDPWKGGRKEKKKETGKMAEEAWTNPEGEEVPWISEFPTKSIGYEVTSMGKKNSKSKTNFPRRRTLISGSWILMHL